jgi:hypothetical protein
MKKKNWFLIIILLAALLIATIIWIYAKRIERIESKMKLTTIYVYTKLLIQVWGEITRKMISASFLIPQLKYMCINHLVLPHKSLISFLQEPIEEILLLPGDTLSRICSHKIT